MALCFFATATRLLHHEVRARVAAVSADAAKLRRRREAVQAALFLTDLRGQFRRSHYSVLAKAAAAKAAVCSDALPTSLRVRGRDIEAHGTHLIARATSTDAPRETPAASRRRETWSAQLRRLAMHYGPLAIGFHVAVEAVVLAGFYKALGEGLDARALLDALEAVTGVNVPISPTASQLLVAYLLTTSLTGFPRTVLTVVATPWIARRLGWRTAPPTNSDNTPPS